MAPPEPEAMPPEPEPMPPLPPAPLPLLLLLPEPIPAQRASPLQSVQTQPSLKSHVPSSVQFAGSLQNESVAQSVQMQASLMSHVPSFTQPSGSGGMKPMQFGLSEQSEQRHPSLKLSHIPSSEQLPWPGSLQKLVSLQQSLQVQASSREHDPSLTHWSFTQNADIAQS